MRFDFPTFNGFTVSTAGVCSDTFAVSGALFTSYFCKTPLKLG